MAINNYTPGPLIKLNGSLINNGTFNYYFSNNINGQLKISTKDPAVLFYNNVANGSFLDFIKKDFCEVESATPVGKALDRIVNWMIGNSAPDQKTMTKQTKEDIIGFSPVTQKTVWDVQTRIREIDMTIYPSLKTSLGEIRTFTYSTLAGCCELLDAVQKNKYSNEIGSFCKRSCCTRC